MGNSKITNSTLHHFVLKNIIERGFAPSNLETAAHFGVSESQVEQSLYDLEQYHGCVLHPHEPRIWVIHPFSTSPTNFVIEAGERTWWGNCGWCSLGAAALIDEDLSILTTIGAEGKGIKIYVKDGQVSNKELVIHFPIPMKNAWDNVQYTCSNMLVFENKQQVAEWSKRHNIDLGDIQPIEKVWELAKKWYGNHLDPHWTKWTVEEASRIFTDLGFTHPVWDLGNSDGRF